MTMQTVDWQDVLMFWFETLSPEQWYRADRAVDGTIAKKFLSLHTKASKGECWHWRRKPGGRLAEIIVLDQFSRNIYRGDARAFAQDAMALVLAQEAVAIGADKLLPLEQRTFMYLPYMHSESLVIHDEALQLFAGKGMEKNYGFEVEHRDIIARFGRYPHRNQILGRDTSALEQEFLQEPGSSF